MVRKLLVEYGYILVDLVFLHQGSNVVRRTEYLRR